MGRGVALATNHQHKTFKYFNQNFGTGQVGMRSPVQSSALVLGGRPARNATHKRCRRGCISAVKAPEYYIQACPVLFYRRGFWSDSALGAICVISKFLNRNRNISTSQLNALLRLHLKPINLVIS